MDEHLTNSTLHSPRRRSRRTVVGLTVTVIVLLLSLPATALGWGYGLNRVQTAAEDSSANTGYGPGWVALSYKANGPAVGYLFAQGFRFSNGTVKSGFDHLSIRGTNDASYGHPTIGRWPWGEAHGGFGGCATAYGTAKFAFQNANSSACGSGPSIQDTAPSWHSETVFCTANGTDPMCSPAGVWSVNKTPWVGGPLRVYSGGCQAYANIGASAAYGGPSSAPTHPIGYVPAGAAMDLRYVVKNRQYAMAKWSAGNLTAGIEWGFFPRSCLGSSPPPPPPAGRAWYLNNNHSGGGGQIAFTYGDPGDVPLTGDWNGDGIDTPGVYRSGNASWHLRNTNSTGAANIAFSYGNPGDLPVVGDWNGDGVDTVGVVRSGVWYLNNYHSGGGGQIAFTYGNPTDVPLAGDWNGDGIDSPGVVR